MNALYIFLGMVGPWQWIIIGLAILLLFGGKKLPELMKGLGGGIKEFKKATKEDDDDDEKKIEDKK
jgi:sec-independent protein translocase protein TatA